MKLHMMGNEGGNTFVSIKLQFPCACEEYSAASAAIITQNIMRW